MTENLDGNKSLTVLPTGKPHVSFSEVKCWKECSYRHKLIHIDKIDISEPSPFLYFGTAVHSGCESLIKTRSLLSNIIIEEFGKQWLDNNFDDPDWIARQPGWYKHEPFSVWAQWAVNMWDDVLPFLDKTFPGWEVHEAEEKLYESVGDLNVLFKGYIDGVLRVPKKSGKGYLYWIVDWKTASAYGWRRSKKQDILMTAQLILYKRFWAQKHGIDLKDIRCGFVLLKRGGKPGKTCELVTVSVGPKSLERASKIVSNMIHSVRKGMFLKNRGSCTFCSFKNTSHCT